MGSTYKRKNVKNLVTLNLVKQLALTKMLTAQNMQTWTMTFLTRWIIQTGPEHQQTNTNLVNFFPGKQYNAKLVLPTFLN